MNAASARAGRVLPYALVRYEDLVERPREVVGGALASLGLVAGDLGFIGKGTVRLRRGHMVSGNPSRFLTGSVPVQADLEWERAMARWPRRVVEAMTWPLLQRFGYVGGATRGEGLRVRERRTRTRRRDR